MPLPSLSRAQSAKILNGAVAVAARGGSAAPGRTVGPAVCLVFDDGYTNDIAIAKPVLDTRGVKGTFACISTLVGNGGRLTWGQAAALQAAGHEIANHSATHVDLTSANAATIATEVTAAHATFVSNGVIPAGFVFPQTGAGNALVRAKLRELYPWACAAGSSGLPAAQTTYAMARIGYGDTTDPATLTAAIDTAIAGNSMAIFFTHSGTQLTDGSRVAAIIDYSQANSVPVLTVSAAVARLGNVFDAGDYAGQSAYTIITADGRLLTSTGDLIHKAPTSITPAATDTPDSYPSGYVSVQTVNNGQTTWPEASYGLVTTNTVARRFSTFWPYVVQTFMSAGGVTYTRRASSATAWSAWTSSANTTSTVAVKALTAIPTDFNAGITIGSIADGTGPGSTNGTLTTFNYATWYAYQTFSVQNSTTHYRRVSASAGAAWGPWGRQPEPPTTGSAAPSTTPTYVGQQYIDTTNKKVYFATGTASSVDWTVVN